MLAWVSTFSSQRLTYFPRIRLADYPLGLTRLGTARYCVASLAAGCFLKSPLAIRVCEPPGRRVSAEKKSNARGKGDAILFLKWNEI